MRYQAQLEKIGPKPSLTTKPETYRTVKHNGDILETRAVLMVLLGIKLLVAFFSCSIKIYNLIRYSGFPGHERESSVTGALVLGVVAASVSLIYVAIFLTVVVKYIRVGILAFAWLTVIDLIAVVIVFTLAVVVLFTMTETSHSIGVGIAASIALLIVSVAEFVITFFAILFAFKLARLITLEQTYQNI